MTTTSGSGQESASGSDIGYRVRLGRYEGSSPSIPPANRVLVRRVKCRSALKDWLSTRGNSGAFLITGSRGAGKSTFVAACLQDHGHDLTTRLGKHRVAGHLLTAIQTWTVAVTCTFLLPWLASQIAGAIVATGTSKARYVFMLPFLWVAFLPLFKTAVDDWCTFRMLRRATQRDGKAEVFFYLRAFMTAGFAVLLVAAVWPAAFDASWERLFGLYLQGGLALGAIFTVLEFRATKRHSYLHHNTLLARFFQMWLPLLKVRVNLGFDNLDQTTVARAMLTALAREHRRTLAGWRSPIRHVALGVSAVIALWIATSLSPVLSAPAFLNHSVSVSRPANGPVWLLTTFLPYADAKGEGQLSIAFALLFAVSLGLLYSASSRHPRLNRRVASLLQSLDSATREVKSGLAFHLGNREPFEASVSKGSNSLTIETGKLDPRQIEHRLLEVIAQMAHPEGGTGAPWSRFALTPSATIIFVFDELDKVGNHRLGATVGPAGEAALPSISHFGSERNRALHRLLSEMKNLVSTAEARFIFIGGRDLDDEWLADRTARRPLLSTVFDGELYLPSLLVDDIGEKPDKSADRDSGPARSLRKGDAFLLGTVEFVRAHRESASLRETYFDGAHAIAVERETWFGPEGEHKPLGRVLDVLHSDDPDQRMSPNPEFSEQLYRYLAVVGRGLPKTLQSLLDEFVWLDEKGAHWLRFQYSDRFRIAFFSRIFNRVAPIVAYRTEDKLVQSAFYLNEFLFKFHKRAFHWSSLELLDELLDVHHAPDLRDLMARIVLEWSQSYIVPIEAGLYRFRFGSAFSAEIRYLSKLSSAAMATFNFTLDETYQLKQEYERRLTLARTSGEDDFTIHSSLGELYDFEEDFQQARHHYFAAIRGLDQALKREYDGPVLRVLGIVRETKPVGETPATEGTGNGAASGDVAIAEQGRAQLNWSVPRVFHKLRIGLTYERTGDYVDALVHYRDARTIANSVVADLLSRIDRRKPVKGDSALANDPPWYETTKDLKILLEPLFACAWIAEKTRSPSSGRVMLEEGIRYTRKLLDRREFWLTYCDMHLKAGAFYLLRGGGWLDHAYSHYATAALCIHAHLSKVNGSDEASLRRAAELGTTIVVRRLAPALLGMAEACFAKSDEIYTQTDAVPLDLDEKTLSSHGKDILDAFGRTGSLPGAFGTYDETYASSTDYTRPPNAAKIPNDAFLWYLKLSHAASHVLKEGGRHERAERVLLTMRRNIIMAAWAVRGWAELTGEPLQQSILDKLFEFCDTLGLDETPCPETWVEQFRNRVFYAARIACQPSQQTGDTSSNTKDPVNELRQLLRKHPYPVRGAIAMRENLLLRSLLIDSASSSMLGGTSAHTGVQSIPEVRELMRLNGEYDSPIHFTPSAFGLVVGLWARQMRKNASASKSREPSDAVKGSPTLPEDVSGFLTEATHQAIKALRKGRGTVTRGPGFREVIENVFYLDDGFSDHELHVGHAQQMFLFELSTKLLDQLERFVELAAGSRPIPDSAIEPQVRPSLAGNGPPPGG